MSPNLTELQKVLDYAIDACDRLDMTQWQSCMIGVYVDRSMGKLCADVDRDAIRESLGLKPKQWEKLFRSEWDSVKAIKKLARFIAKRRPKVSLNKDAAKKSAANSLMISC